MRHHANIFVVIDPTTENQPALDRAMKFTEDTCSWIHLFLCDYKELEEMDAHSKRSGKQKHMDEQLEWLKSLIEPHKENENAKFSTEVYWNKSWHEAVGCASTRRGSTLIIKSTFSHSKKKRLFSKTSDLMLIRRACCPVLMVREDFEWKSGRILAALDLESHDEGHLRLNNQIMRHAHFMAQVFGMELHIVNASSKQPKYEHLVLDAEEVGDSPDEIVELRFGVSRDRVHIQAGKPKDVILKVAEEVNPDVTIIGTLGRSGVTGAILGNTAEKVLDALTMDVLAIS